MSTPTQQQHPYARYINTLANQSRILMSDDPAAKQSEISVCNYLWEKLCAEQTKLQTEHPTAGALERANLLIDWYIQQTQRPRVAATHEAATHEAAAHEAPTPKQLLAVLAIALMYKASDIVRSDESMETHQVLMRAITRKLDEPEPA